MLMVNNKQHIYFLGIGGIGMSALARYFNSKGVHVSGYDKTETPLTRMMATEGIDIHYNDLGDKAVAQVDTVVYTPAIPSDLGEYIAFRNSTIPMMKRAEVLGEISKNYFTIAIAGTHGKTTITSMIAHFLSASGIKVNAFIGGISSNYNSNLILDAEAEIMVVEADEFDRSFLHLHPDIAIISSMDADHLDIYDNKESLRNTFNDFAHQIKPGGKLILFEDLELPNNSNIDVLSYGEKASSNFHYSNAQLVQAYQEFEFIGQKQYVGKYQFNMPGHHNLLNATAAIGACLSVNVDLAQLQGAVASYKGVKRRFERIIDGPNLVLVDDYAHHPTEIRASIAAARQMYPAKRLMGIFQPHLYSRTRDFAEDFAEELAQLDVLVLLDIYPARELPIEGVSSAVLLDKIKLKEKYLLSKDELAAFVVTHSPEVILMMGAGDIDREVYNVKQSLLNA